MESETKSYGSVDRNSKDRLCRGLSRSTSLLEDVASASPGQVPSCEFEIPHGPWSLISDSSWLKLLSGLATAIAMNEANKDASRPVSPLIRGCIR